MRRYLVAAAVTKEGMPTQLLVTSVITLEADEAFNALAVQQVTSILKEQLKALDVAILNFQPLETAPGQVAALYPPRAGLLQSWMVANEYCTDNEIEGPGDAIDQLVRDHALLKTEREHLQGLLQMATNTLSSFRSDTGAPAHLREDAINVLATLKNIRKHLTEMRVEVTDRPSFDEACDFDPVALGTSSS